MKSIVFALSVVAIAVGCYPAKMAVHADAWPAKEEYEVKGKRGLFTKERMQFGEYHTASIKRSWVKGSTSRFGLASGNATNYNYTNFISLDYIRKKQTIKFSLTDAAAQASEVYYVSKLNTEEIVIGNSPSSVLNTGVDIVKTILSQPDSKYYVQIYTKERERPWELLLDNVQSQWSPKSYVGYLSQGKDRYYIVVPVREMEGEDGKPASTLFGTVVFEIRNTEGKAVAAVSMLGKGVVYLQSNDAEEKFLLANACAALLMQDVIG